MPEIYIIKSNGEREVFDYSKLEASLKKIGTDDLVVKEILEEIAKELHEGITTREIYKRAYSILRKKQKTVSLRYSLKKAVAELGPTGFPFEKYVAEIFKSQGYETETGVIVKGKCVEHEIDVVAWKEGELIMTEAKFHTDFNLKSDLKVVLYVKARYDDLYGNRYVFGGKERELTEGWIVTNTKFSSTAIQYDQCQPHLKLVGWNYPYGNNLHNMIERAELIPITALTSINTIEKNMFLARGVVLSKALLDENLLKEVNFDEKKIKSIITEVNSLCEHCKAQFN
ncbi:MAG: ATP cone domain-containing protein [Candidatus Paceibacterota bacterium]|jgi:hypothetical protein